MKSNLILVGMPGAGKSTLGVLLAKSLGYQFVDTDLIIQEQQGKLLQDIIDQEGMATFLKAEEAALESVRVERSVIATGGSAVYCDQGMAHLKENGEVIYLQLNYETIMSRLYNITTRGIAIPSGSTLEDVYSERHNLYIKYADHIIDLENRNIEESMVHLESLLK